MSDYIRTTRECSVGQLQPELLQAIKNYFEEHQLGDLEVETRICCETISTKKKIDKLASLLKVTEDSSIRMGMLLTSQKLIWVRKGDRSGIQLVSADLTDIQVRAYMSILTKDTGLEISGYIGDSKRKVRGYVGMGTEPEAQRFCEEVEKAILEINPPVKKGWPKWLGGS
jgi:hypothetical protein